mmetsp:Transcript_26391/g.74280  ORF Transcript_26391/g.74280 Transcript_26391/m.74280 type:complete len:91 (-) Transcript_26391:500-772(-)
MWRCTSADVLLVLFQCGESGQPSDGCWNPQKATEKTATKTCATGKGGRDQADKEMRAWVPRVFGTDLQPGDCVVEGRQQPVTTTCREACI